VLLCEEMGIATGIDVDAMIAAGHLAERILGVTLPSALLRGGSLTQFRAKARAA
jgi:hydroxymethylglutaryl-CoA lyase